MEASYEEILKCTEHDIYKEIFDRIEYHIKITRRQCRVYWALSVGLQWLIPILSATLGILPSQKIIPNNTLELLSFLIGGTVAIFSVVNSAVQPSKRFAFAKTYANKLWEFRINLKLNMEKMLDDESKSNQERKIAINRLLHEKNKEIAKLIDEFNKGPELNLVTGQSPETQR
ncbi:MAG: hypothetical protein M3A44_06955 [Gammaproteobacteria bacterium]